MREDLIERSIVGAAARLGYDGFKFVSPGRRGVPDRMFISRTGKVVFIEVKRRGGVLSPLQARELKLLNRRGVPAIAVFSLEEAIPFLEAHQ